MKKLLFPALLIVFSSMTFGQKYVPFPTENAEWHIKLSKGDDYTPFSVVLQKYILKGDTTYNGRTYHKLYYITGTQEQPVYKLKGGLCEENKRIYYHDYTSLVRGYLFNIIQKSNELKNCIKSQQLTVSDEYLLYDFNKTKIGDTLFVTPYGTPVLITKIDSILIQNSYRKRYEYGALYGGKDYAIEGIGSVKQGLLGVITPLPMCGGYSWEFVCFSQNGESVYKNPLYADCNSPYYPSTNNYCNTGDYWTVYDFTHYLGGTPVSFLTGKDQYFLGTDTIINSKTYKQFLQRTPNNFLQPITFLGGLRKENGKMYAYLKQYQNVGDFLLYDFTLNVGDTIKSNFPFGPLSRKQLVYSVETILMETGEIRKYFHSTGYNYIDGIGSISGPLSVLYELCTCNPYVSSSLVCFKSADTNLYIDKYSCTDGTCCDLYMGIKDIKTDKKHSTVLPNPTKDVAILQFTNGDLPSVSVEIINVMGRSMKSIPVTNSSEYKLDLTDCAVGIYYVLVKYKDRTESHKIIKM